MQRHSLAVALALLALGSGAPRAQAPAVTVAAGHDRGRQARARRSPPTMYGIFFEDINFAADGGLYPERVKNRVVRVPRGAHGLEEVGQRPTRQGEFAVRDAIGRRRRRNPHYLRVTSKAGSYGITNDGFRVGQRRSGEALRRDDAGAPRLGDGRSLSVGIENARMEPFGRRDDRQRCRPSGAPSPRRSRRRSPTTRGRFRVRLDGPGAVDLDMVSLMPADTWKKRPNGLRADLVQLLADLKPGFLRFPGGCIVEGRYLDDPLRVEEDHRRAGRSAAADHQPLERRVRPSAGGRLLPVVRPRLLRVLPAVPRTSAPSRCRSSTAAWPASSTPTSWCRSTSSIPTCRTRST